METFAAPAAQEVIIAGLLSALIATERSPEFPTGYWPEKPAPPDEKAWNQSVDGFRAEFKALMAMVNDPAVNLVTELAHAEGQTILRKLLMLADHNSYHLGQMVVVRRLLGAWD